MATVLIQLRKPFPPHQVVGDPLLADSSFRYGFNFMESSAIGFKVSRATATSAHLFRRGMMVSIERDDGLFPWAGFITHRKLSLADPTATIICSDYRSAIYARARTAKGWGEMTGSAGSILERVWHEANGRQEPPLVTHLPNLHGPPVKITPRAETMLQFINDLAFASDWEWGLRYTVSRQELRTDLVWQKRLGKDYSTELVIEADMCEEATIDEDSEAKVVSALLVGGSGTFADRPAVQVNAAGRIDEGIEAEKVTVAKPTSPALMGTRVDTFEAVTDKATLQAGARRLFSDPRFEGDRITLRIAESRVDLDKIAIGNKLGVRFKDIDLGLPYERVVRCLGLTLGTNGIIEIVGEAA